MVSKTLITCMLTSFNFSYRFKVIAVKSLADVRTYSAAFKYSPFLLISYDMALRYIFLFILFITSIIFRTREKLFQIEFDVIICDEGHRLKSMTSKLRNTVCFVFLQH